MESEILYRAKRKNWKELLKEKWWVEGNLLISDENYYIVPSFGVSFVEELKGYVCDRLITLHAYEVDTETVCQYTDAIDIELKKIFTNDIVEENGTIGIVKFGKYGNGFHLGYYIDWITCPHLRNELHYWEGRVRVIGNIFDNPELLKGDSK